MLLPGQYTGQSSSACCCKFVCQDGAGLILTINIIPSLLQKPLSVDFDCISACHDRSKVKLRDHIIAFGSVSLFRHGQIITLYTVGLLVAVPLMSTAVSPVEDIAVQGCHIGRPNTSIVTLYSHQSTHKQHDRKIQQVGKQWQHYAHLAGTTRSTIVAHVGQLLLL
jgi:hypothetical protein